MQKPKTIRLDIPIEFIEFKYCFGGKALELDYVTSSDTEMLDKLEEQLELAKEFGEDVDEVILTIEEIQFRTLFMEDAMDLVVPDDEEGPSFIGFFTTPNLLDGITEIHGIVQLPVDNLTYIFTNNRRLRNFLITPDCETYIFEGDPSSKFDFLDLNVNNYIPQVPKGFNIKIKENIIHEAHALDRVTTINPQKLTVEFKE